MGNPKPERFNYLKCLNARVNLGELFLKKDVSTAHVQYFFFRIVQMKPNRNEDENRTEKKMNR